MAEEAVSSSVSVIAVTGAVGAVVLLLVLLCNIGKTAKKDTHNQSNGQSHSKGKKAKAAAAAKAKSKIPYKVKRTTSVSFTHPLLVGTLKGHLGPVLGLDISPNGKYLATVSEDRSVLIWSVKEFTASDHKANRAKIELDHGNHVKFSPDSRAFLIDTESTSHIQVYKMDKKSDGSLGVFSLAREFPYESSKDVVCVDIASSGKFLMVCFSDTTLKLWDINGSILHKLDTKQINNYHAAISPCGRFLASAGFTADVKVWEVAFDKSGTFQEVSRAFELTGHKAGVYSFAFNNDSSRMATVSKDNTWKFWETNVVYQQGQDPILLYTGSITITTPCRIALSSSGYSAAIASGNTVALFSTFDGQAEEPITDLYAGDITGLAIDPSEKYVVTCGDRYSHVFCNLPNYHSRVSSLEKDLRAATKDMVKARIRKQIQDAQKSLASIQTTMNGRAVKK